MLQYLPAVGLYDRHFTLWHCGSLFFLFSVMSNNRRSYVIFVTQLAAAESRAAKYRKWTICQTSFLWILNCALLNRSFHRQDHARRGRRADLRDFIITVFHLNFRHHYFYYLIRRSFSTRRAIMQSGVNSKYCLRLSMLSPYCRSFSSAVVRITRHGSS